GEKTGTASIYLCNGPKNIMMDWTKWDLSGLGKVLKVTFNVTGSSVCLGSANIDLPKNLTYESLLQYWEKKFWLTEFSHLGGNGNPTRSNLVLVTKAARNKPFDLKELKPLNNMKLKDILT
ncbi:DUF4465 domain-containing protein, partial [uncultured Bacteroides sp.]|uniref:DUF4465 domain-containing protein n=1 Tax=uncultured Bacteroides sp. TaxID=162156 RepID=UPI0025F13510